MLIDSHAHLFLEQFDSDLDSVITRAKEAGVTHIFMPNIDHSSLEPLLSTCAKYPDYCFPMIGLHPTSVKNDYHQELDIVENALKQPNSFVAIGEIGIDLYWDRTFIKEQILVFERQIELALEYNLPIVVHSRESFHELNDLMSRYKNTDLKGIFHSFTGTYEEACQLLDYKNFMLGINGVVTFKNSTLPHFLNKLPLDRIVAETDSPYLAPVPYRGQRNECSYVKSVVTKIADIFNQNYDIVSNQLAENTLNVFGLNK